MAAQGFVEPLEGVRISLVTPYMKIYKKIFTGIIVAITIIGLVAFYIPVRNIRPKVSPPTIPENLSASLNNPASSISTSTNTTSSLQESPIPSFEDMSGFFDLGQESDLVEKMSASSSSSTIDDFLNF